MEKVKTASGEITLLNEADIVECIENIFNSSAIEQLIVAAAENKVPRTDAVNIVAEIVIHYICATGDKNVESIDALIYACVDNIALLSDKTYAGVSQPVNKKKNLFEAVVYPMIVNYWKSKLGIIGNTLTDMGKIVTMVKTQCINNRFLTHSFNGALGQSVAENGLDISKEMFVDEYNTISKISKTPYSTGTLYFCELGTGTFSYMHRSPERFWNTIDGFLKPEENEDIKDFAIRNFKAMLTANKDKVSKDELKQIYDAGMRMIDFYCSTPEVCVAVKKNTASVKTDFDMAGSMALKAKRLLSALPFKVKMKLPRDFLQRLNKIPNNAEGLDQLGEIIEQCKAISPDVEKIFANISTQITQYTMEEMALNNFAYEGYLDGYKIEGGKLAKKDFVLARVVDPVLQTYHEQELTL